MPMLDKDMVLCISLAGRPSNIGTRFHNFCYDELGLPFVYKAFTTTSLPDAIAGVRGLGIRGCSVSMPFKEDVIALVDTLDPSAEAIASVNTIVNDGGVLAAYNTDYLAACEALSEHGVDPSSRTVVRGSGGMAKAVVAALRGSGFDDVTVWARNAVAGRELAAQYGYRSTVDAPTASSDFNLIVNVTPVGMNAADGTPSSELSFDLDVIEAATTVFDVIAFPAETPLVRASAGKQVITGAEIIAAQAAHQFRLYTGVDLTRDLIDRASAFSRA